MRTYSAIVDSMFLVDVLLGFVTSFTGENEMEVVKLRRTAMHYLQTWFALDVLASIPFSLIGLLGGEQAQQQPAANLNKVLRLAKLLKLLRLLRLKRAVPHLDVYPIFSHPMLRLAPLILCLVYYLHVCACLLHFAMDELAVVLGLEAFPELYGWSMGWIVALTFGLAYPYSGTIFISTSQDLSS